MEKSFSVYVLCKNSVTLKQKAGQCEMTWKCADKITQ